MSSGTTRGPFGFVALVLASAVSLGLLVIAATVCVVDALRHDAHTGNLDVLFSLLVVGTLSGILGAAYVAWRLLAPVGSLYRRGGLSIVSAFATVPLMLVCIPVNQLFGQRGLLLLVATSAVLAVILPRQARRWGTGT